ncbi:dihydrofolate reductase family protein [Microtetraspora sp. NBRC 16547]|uniref:dihydrofolate reductase family protein n=1 Tax=Microtetraspora sp. NBRC 16547 TaxID=3030993 RepID=UPI0024A1173F|nr:dihydrofolate reductase family protein [Microtetraspora sp. NBRC 16547]GLW97699.1 deaminase [Microtetraspora sp. NBRC 16547]
MRKLTYYIGMTIDGFIAAPDGAADFFPVTQDVIDFIRDDYPDTLPSHVRPQFGLDDGNRDFDTVVQGRVTYEPALEIGVTSPYAHMRQYVVSGSIAGSPDPAVEIVTGDVLAKIRELKAEDGKGIYLAGGARLAGAVLPEIDELVIKIYPVVAGSGIPLFTADFSPAYFELTGTRVLDSGMAVLTYVRK